MRSSAPQSAAAAGWAPTGAVTNASWPTCASPSPGHEGRWVQVAAVSHSASVGSRAPWARAKAAASNQLTWHTGRSGSRSRGPQAVCSHQDPSGRRAQCRGPVMSHCSFHAQASSLHHSRWTYPPPSANVSQVAFVTGVRAIRKGATSTSWTGRSLS